MQGKFQYIMTGAAITLLVLIGVFALLLVQTRADDSPTREVFDTAAQEDQQSVDLRVTIPPSPYVEKSLDESNEAYKEQEDSANIDLQNRQLVVQSGTVDDPVTDIDMIILTVAEFVRVQEEALLSSPGWLHVKSTLVIPEQMRGNGYHVAGTDEVLPMQVLVPASPIYETWYHIDQTGTYSEAMGLVSSQEDAIHQRTILIDGQWINLTLKTAGARREQYETRASVDAPLLPISLVLQALEERREWRNINIYAYSDKGRFIVIAEQQYDSPIDNAISITEPVSGSREIFNFEEGTGRLLSREAQVLPLNGSWLTTEKEDYLVVELTSELSHEASRLFSDAMNLLEEGN